MNVPYSQTQLSASARAFFFKPPAMISKEEAVQPVPKRIEPRVSVPLVRTPQHLNTGFAVQGCQPLPSIKHKISKASIGVRGCPDRQNAPPNRQTPQHLNTSTAQHLNTCLGICSQKTIDTLSSPPAPKFFDPEFSSKYSVISHLGSGSFASVWLVTSLSNPDLPPLAAKSLPLNTSTAQQLNTSTLIQNEIRALRTLKSPHIPRLYEVVRTNLHCHLLMENIQGETLSTRLLSSLFSEAEARGLFLQLASTVGEMASRGVYHRDLKPENLMICEGGRLVVVDFGFAYSKKVCGTIGYCAPEAVEAVPEDLEAAEVWTLGVILLEVLTGKLYDANPALEGLSKSAAQVVAKCLQLQPPNRPRIREILLMEWIKE